MRPDSRSETCNPTPDTLGSRPMTEPFRWKNCAADTTTWRHGRLAREFLHDVVQPSLYALDARIDKCSASDDPVAAFVLNDVEELRRVTTMAFCLSIQSMWERQIRTYFRGCAIAFSNDRATTEKALVAPWEDLDEFFLELRGIRMSSFEEYRQLDLLHLLANVCRHGDGPSSRRLWHRCPEFWPDRIYHPRPSRTTVTTAKAAPSSANMHLAGDRLHTFVSAIASFWEEVEYIYLESLERKHESVERKLAKLRRERAKKRNGPMACPSARTGG